MISLLIPTIITFILLFGFTKKLNITDEFADGAKENLYTAAKILPMLILLMTAVGMFTASGAVEIIANFLSPVIDFLGFPKECLTLAIIRPFSGSGAIAVLENILNQFDADSYPARMASVLMGSTETTFYTITIYYAAIKKKPEPKVFLCAFAADLTGFVFSSLIVNLYFN